MYNVFTNIILTSKGKVCIQAKYDSINSQYVYASLLETYNDQLSTKTKLWTPYYEAGWQMAQMFWYLPPSLDLQCKLWWSKMYLAHQHASTAKGHGQHHLPGYHNLVDHWWFLWYFCDNKNSVGKFYNMVLPTAKMLDITRDKTSVHQQVINQQQHSPNGNHSQGTAPATPKPYTTYTVPHKNWPEMTSSMMSEEMRWCLWTQIKINQKWLPMWIGLPRWDLSQQTFGNHDQCTYCCATGAFHMGIARQKQKVVQNICHSPYYKMGYTWLTITSRTQQILQPKTVNLTRINQKWHHQWCQKKFDDVIEHNWQ
jgi:hypothetical protein